MSDDSMVVVFDGDAVVTENKVQNALSKTKRVFITNKLL